MRHTILPATLSGTLLLAAFAAACTDEGIAPVDPNTNVPEFGKSGGSSLYRLEFLITDVNAEGEMVTRASYPIKTVTLNTNDPWRQFDAAGVPLRLLNYTHGKYRTDTTAGCRTGDRRVNWDIDLTGTPYAGMKLSFDGHWLGDMSIWRSKGGLNFTYNAARVVSDTSATTLVADTTTGWIRNVASNNNAATETKAADNSWFQVTFRNALLGFGSRGTPDGTIKLDQIGSAENPPSYEAACANFTVKATRI